MTLRAMRAAQNADDSREMRKGTVIKMRGIDAPVRVLSKRRGGIRAVYKI